MVLVIIGKAKSIMSYEKKTWFFSYTKENIYMQTDLKEQLLWAVFTSVNDMFLYTVPRKYSYASHTWSQAKDQNEQMHVRI